MSCVDLTDGEPDQQQLQDIDEQLQQVEEQIDELLAKQRALQEKRDRLQDRIAADHRAPRADWRSEFPWDAECTRAMAQTFDIHAYRPLQREIINATLQGRDVLCLLPTGGGKSLCYQLPALISGGITLVVSPLLSLIHDQVMGLRELGIPAIAITSLTPKEDISEAMKELDNSSSTLRLVYVTPERVVTVKRFMSKLEKLHKAGRLKRIAIDEAHCCSQWGNDFRPDYKKLGILKQQFPDIPIIALTATATETVCQDLRKILRISACETFRASVDRPNLFYSVIEKPSSASAAAGLVVALVQQSFKATDSGIVYCQTRKDSESLAGQLQEAGTLAAFYHADMDPAVREATHLQWSKGAVQVIVATVAFGMGINKADVRFVIHASLSSKSMENYYQEAGRAGRDGQRAECILLYRFADALKQAAMVCYEPGWEGRLGAILSYAASAAQCRRGLIARHFGEAAAQCERMCDCCARGGTAAVDRRNVSGAAAGVARTLADWASAEKRATLLQLVDAWRGSKVEGVGAVAKAMSKDDNERVIAQMLREGYLAFDFGTTAYAVNAYLKATPRASLLLQGKQQVWLEAVREQARVPAAPAAGTAPAKGNSGRKRKASGGSAPAARPAQAAGELAAAGRALAASAATLQPGAAGIMPAVLLDSSDDDGDFA